MNRRLGVLVACALVGVVAGCTGSSESSSDSGAAAPYAAEQAGEDAVEQGEKPKADANRDVSQPGVDRKLVRTAAIELEAEDVADVVDRARDVAATEGGYAGREEVREESADLTLHIPSDRFDAAVDELSGLGTVVSRKQSVEDVTEQVVDLDSRVATQRASVNRVRALLARASTVDEIVRIEQEVTTREADLESLEQRRQALAGQVAMSRVPREIGKADAVPAPPPEEATGFLAGLAGGWNAFLDAGGVALQVVGALLPFLLLLGVPAGLGIRWWRRRRTPVVQQSS